MTKPMDLPVDQIRSWYEEGCIVQEIADRLHVGGKAVYNAMRRNGIPRRTRGAREGSLNRFWNGGRRMDADGYILIYSPTHPFRNLQNAVREHRLVMEQKLGRYLSPDEVVHHLDGNRQNNHPDNLQVYERNAEHLRETLKGKIPKWTPEGLKSIQAANQRQAQRARASRSGSGSDDSSSS